MLDESAQTLFLTELFRGLNYTLKSFFDPKVTVGSHFRCGSIQSTLLLVRRKDVAVHATVDVSALM